MGYQLIETIEVGSGGAASIEFTGIPQDGVDLQLVISSRSDGSNQSQAGWIKFNGSATDPAGITLSTINGATPGSLSWRYSQRVNGGASTANTFTNTQLYFSNYTSSAAKSYSSDTVAENNSSEGSLFIFAGAWSGTDAITSLEVICHNASYVQYTTASIYSIS
jgi:hypothetical protein